MRPRSAFIFLLLINISVLAQQGPTVKQQDPPKKRWTALTGNDVFVYSCMAISGAADGLNQAIIHHQFGQGNKFWDIAISWQNKYKNWSAGDYNSAFPGSKNVFVAFTDAFHLSRMVDRGFTLGAICLSTGNLKQYKKKDRWKVVIKKAIVCTLVNRFTFDVLFNNLHGPL